MQKQKERDESSIGNSCEILTSWYILVYKHHDPSDFFNKSFKEDGWKRKENRKRVQKSYVLFEKKIRSREETSDRAGKEKRKRWRKM